MAIGACAGGGGLSGLTEGAEQGRQGHGGSRLGHNLTVGRHVVHKSAGLSVWGVHGTQEAPGLRQQLAHGRGPHFGEGRASVHAAEVGQVADEVELVGHHAEARGLQHAQTCAPEGESDHSGATVVVFFPGR